MGYNQLKEGGVKFKANLSSSSDKCIMFSVETNDVSE